MFNLYTREPGGAFEAGPQHARRPALKGRLGANFQTVILGNNFQTVILGTITIDQRSYRSRVDLRMQYPWPVCRHTQSSRRPWILRSTI